MTQLFSRLHGTSNPHRMMWHKHKEILFTFHDTIRIIDCLTNPLYFVNYTKYLIRHLRLYINNTRYLQKGVSNFRANRELSLVFRHTYTFLNNPKKISMFKEIIQSDMFLNFISKLLYKMCVRFISLKLWPTCCMEVGGAIANP